MITRNNYEEFFLLYVDNELSAADRQIVERFVAENPDLQEEWDLLLQCRIRPDQHLVFTDRESLLKQEEGATELINAGNCETYFLSYIDGELDADTCRSVEAFVRRHPSRLSELQRLQQTVSVPDYSIIFEHKELLYKEERPRRIGFFPWKIAAAAVVLGVIGLMVFYSSHGPDKAGIAGASLVHGKSGADAVGSAGRDGVGSARSAGSADATHSAGASDASHAAGSTDTADSAPVSGGSVAAGASVKKDPLAVTPGPAAALHLSDAGQARKTAGTGREQQQRVVPAEHKEGKDEVESIAVLTQENLPANKKMIDQAPVSVVASNVDGPGKKAIVLIMPAATDNRNTSANASFATQALLASSNGSPEDGYDMESASVKKNKLRGLFRKVTRVLEKNTGRDEDDRRSVQIGGFQFALK